MRGVVLVLLVGCWRSPAPISEPPSPRPANAVQSRPVILDDPPRRRATPPDVSRVVPGPVSFGTGSPGPLAAGHAAWDHGGACNVCHSDGVPDVPREKCLACHAPIASRIAEKRGLHGNPQAAWRTCESCHHDHKGRGFDLMGWMSEPGGRPRFQHARTGWPIPPAYRGAPCTRCHATIDGQGLSLFLDADRALFQ
jgi:hypothetical protein